MNYFSLFGLPEHYQVDISLLRLTFQNLQRKNHPDNFINSSQLVQKNAVYKTSIINQAWHTLSDPIARAEHLLALHGFDATNDRHVLKDNTFLMKQLQLREELDVIKKTKDKSHLKIFIKNIDQMFDIHYQKIMKSFDSKCWDKSIDIVYKLRFFKQLRKDAEIIEETLINF